MCKGSIQGARLSRLNILIKGFDASNDAMSNNLSSLLCDELKINDKIINIYLRSLMCEPINKIYASGDCDLINYEYIDEKPAKASFHTQKNC